MSDVTFILDFDHAETPLTLRAYMAGDRLDASHDAAIAALAVGAAKLNETASAPVAKAKPE
jgi:hypothetical protein